MLRKAYLILERLMYCLLFTSTAFFASPIDAQTKMVPGKSIDNWRLHGLHTDQRAEPQDQPTQVNVGLRLLDVTTIEDISQTITADFFVTKTWRDPRLIDYQGCQFDPNAVWTPQIDILNSGRLFKRMRDYVEILEDGWIRQAQRYRGPLVFVYDAHQFPFDTHDIVISLLTAEYQEDKVVLEIDQTVTGRKSDPFNVPDWKINKVEARIGSRLFEITGNKHSIFRFNINTSRRSGYFVWKVMVPLILIVFMSWSVFWIDPTQSGTQITMSATSMLTLIAFQFAMSNILPPLSYFTVMDKFITGSTFLVFLALMESVFASFLSHRDKPMVARKLDRISRWLFPTAFLLMILIVYTT